MKIFSIVSVNVSKTKGVKKTPINRIEVIKEWGIKGDAHAGNGHRQVSLLAVEEIEFMAKRLAGLKSGDFAENITTFGVDLSRATCGVRLIIGQVVLEVTQIGKTCHNPCEIHRHVGACIMPSKGIFTRVLQGGIITHESIGMYDF